MLPRRVISLLVAGLLVQACAITGGVTSARGWTVGSADANGSSATTQVNDSSGRVQDIEIDPSDAVVGAGVVVVPGVANTLDVPWVGGSCDLQTDVDIQAVGAGLGVTVRITRDATKPCDAMGVIRTLRLHLDRPIAPGMVVVRQ
jgi:hypothetical protein